MTQFYQLTLNDALTQYQAGFLSSAGLLFNYLKIKFAPGSEDADRPTKSMSGTREEAKNG